MIGNPGKRMAHTPTEQLESAVAQEQAPSRPHPPKLTLRPDKATAYAHRDSSTLPSA